EKPKAKEKIPLCLPESWNKGEGLGFDGIGGFGFGLRGTIRLPSFKVKRKEPPEAALGGEQKRIRPSPSVDEEDEECERDRDALGTPSDPAKKDADPVNIHRKPARPLTSEGEEEAESDGEQETSYKEDALSEKDEEQDSNSVLDLSSKEQPFIEDDDQSSSSSSESDDEETSGKEE
ncbi:unnamed protein product, partial [Staurois parvus]